MHRPGSLAPPRTPAGGINPAPTNGGKARDQPGKRDPGNAANLCRGRFHIGPVCGGAGFRGRNKSRPYEQILCFGPTGKATAARAGVGRGALTPPDRAAPQTPRADMESAPTNGGKARDQPGKREPGNVANLCRGRCLHRPGSLAPPRTPAGGINPAPTNGGKARDQPGTCEPGNAANPPFLNSPRCGGRKRPPYGTGKT